MDLRVGGCLLVLSMLISRLVELSLIMTLDREGVRSIICLMVVVGLSRVSSSVS